MLFRYHWFSVNWDKRYVKNELTWPIAPLSLFSFKYHLLVLAPPSPFANLNPNLMLKASTMTHNHRPQLLHHSLHYMDGWIISVTAWNHASFFFFFFSRIFSVLKLIVYLIDIQMNIYLKYILSWCIISRSIIAIKAFMFFSFSIL